jgi:hypothetical protein
MQGGCHCGALAFRLNWPETESIPARRCTCSYCTRFNGTWTSHPEASLEIFESPANPALRYRFGTGTADFLVCSRCGIPVAAVCDAGRGLQAVVNVNTLAESAGVEFNCSDSNFDGEALEDRLARRLERWIAEVRISRR